MGDKYWKFLLGGLTPVKYQSLLTTLQDAPKEATIFALQYNGSSTAVLCFGGPDVTATVAWIQTNIIVPLGLLTSSSQPTVAGDLCKTGADIAAGL